MFANVCNNRTQIGYGHVLEDAELSGNIIQIDGETVNVSEGITPEQAEKLLKQDLDTVQTAVKRAITNPITQQQFDALVDFAYNVGVHTFEQSEVVKLITDKKYDHVCREFMAWQNACGQTRADLVSRRRANALKFAGLVRVEMPLSVTTPSTPGRGGGATSERGTIMEPNLYPRLEYAPSVIQNPANPRGFTELKSSIKQVVNQVGVNLNTNLLVRSGYRSPEYNATRSGAVPNSQHINGIAMDVVAVGSNVTLYQIQQEFRRLIGTRGGYTWIYDGARTPFVHLDIRGVNVPAPSRPDI
jgi:GH24 family phage-related lysozyme (muramidase)